MATSTITSKGQITIPKKIRNQLNLQPGDILDFEVDQDQKIRITAAKRNADEAYGILYRNDQEALTIEEMDEGVSEYFKEKYRTE